MILRFFSSPSQTHSFISLKSLVIAHRNHFLLFSFVSYSCLEWATLLFPPSLHEQEMIIRSSSLEHCPWRQVAANTALHITDPGVNQPGIIGRSSSTGCIPSCAVTAGYLAPESNRPAHWGTAESMAPFMGLPTPPRSPSLQRYMAAYPYMQLSVENHGIWRVDGKYISFCKFMESKYCSSPPSWC